MEQIGCSATQETWVYLHSCRYVLHDRDAKFCASFRSTLASGGVETIPLPARSPNLNAFAERWVRSVKQECLSKVILFGAAPLWQVLGEHSRHYHSERNHQGKSNKLLFPNASEQTQRGQSVACRHRLGGLEHARPLLERVVKDLGRCLSQEHELRLKAIASLRDLLVVQGHYESAAMIQRELLECQVQRLGSDHPDTLATRASLAMMLLKQTTCDSVRAVS